jgi:hypothetical protein
VDDLLAGLQIEYPTMGLFRRIPMDLIAQSVAQRLTHGPVTDARICDLLKESFERNIMTLPDPVVKAGGDHLATFDAQLMPPAREVW